MSPLEVAVSRISDISDTKTVQASLISPSIKTVTYAGKQTLGAYTRAYGQAATGELLAILDTAVKTLKSTGDLNSLGIALLVEKFGDRFAIGDGLPLDDDATQEDLNTLLPIIGDDRLRMLKSLGAIYITPLASVGITTEPSIEEIEAVCITVLAKRRSTLWVEQVNTVIGNNGNGFTVEQLKEQITKLAVPGEE